VVLVDALEMEMEAILDVVALEVVVEMEGVEMGMFFGNQL